MRYPTWISFTFLLVFLSGCVKPELLTSPPLDRTITVDGLNAEWEGQLSPVGDNPVSLGLLNDADHLYLAFAATDPVMVRQILMRGMTIWFDAAGGKEKAFGIRYPIGLIGSQPEQQGPPDGNITARLEATLSRLEIMFGEDDAMPLAIHEAKGLKLAANLDFDALTFELKIPLAASDDAPYAINAAPGSTVGIGLLTAEFDGLPPGGFQGGNMGGGMGGRGGMRGGGMGGRGGGQFPPGPQGMQQLKVWTQVALSGE